MYIYTYFIREKKNEEDRDLRKSVFPSNTRPLYFFLFSTYPEKSFPDYGFARTSRRGGRRVVVC